MRRTIISLAWCISVSPLSFALPILFLVPSHTIGINKAKTISELPPPEDRWALVIGVRHYARHLDVSLDGDRDAKAFADALVKYANFPYNHVFRLYQCSERDQLPANAIGQDSQQPCQDEYPSPTRNQVLETLWNIRHNVPPDGLLLIFFAGHGQETSDTDALFTADAPLSSDDEGLITRTSVTLNDIRQAIKESEVHQVMLFLDSCRTVAQGVGEFDTTLTKGFSDKVAHMVDGIGTVDAFAILFATTKNESAYPDRKMGMGLFTEVVVEGLAGGAADAQGRITLSGLERYVRRVVVDRAKSAHLIQTPSAYVDRYDANSLIIAMKSQELPTPAVPLKVSVLDFEGVDTSQGIGHVSAGPYLEGFGITLEVVTPGTQVVVIRNTAMYGGLVLYPPSGNNLLYQNGTRNDPASFTLRFAKPLRSVTFTRPEILVKESGVTFPEWTAIAMNSRGDETQRVGERMISSYKAVPAKTFTLEGKDIVRVRFDSNSKHWAAFESIVLDDLILDPEEN
jgi:uncharacterized caspase-like protein